MTGMFNVSLPPAPPPTAPTISSAAPVFHQNFKRNGKRKGNPVLIGYTINFNTTMDPTALASGNSYAFDIWFKKLVKVPGKKKKVPQLVLKPIGFQVMSATSTSVTLAFAGKQKFPKGGQIDVKAGSVDDSAGTFLARDGIVTIAKGGKTVTVTTN
jgi:hypothetical protein